MDKMPGASRIEILPDRKEYSPGEKLTGTVQLRLAKPMPARGLHVSFFGTGGVLGNEGIHEDFLVTAKLTGRRTYSTYEVHTFSLSIPCELPTTKVYTYYIKAWLDVPVRLDALRVIKVDMAHAHAPVATPGEFHFLTMFVVCALALASAYFVSGISFHLFIVLLLVLIAVGLFYTLYIARRFSPRP
ncbi:MAG: hypothetical protein WC263_02510 [Candidatus Micrarchaeia archaeon]|jgi:hypothetical protein